MGWGMHLLKTWIGWLRVVGILEGISFIVLLGVAMPLKYLAGQPEAVRVVGMAHGILFLAYVWLTVQAALHYGWTWGRGLVVGVASLLPFGPFVVEAKILRHVKDVRAAG